MSDTFGALQLPVAETDTAGDPGLKKFGDYLAAVINEKCAAAWLASRPRSEEHQKLPVRRVFTHDPNERSISDKDFPALFVWREGGTAEQLAEDWYEEYGAISALWVFPPDQQANQVIRDPFVNALAKAVESAIETCREPAYVDPDDSDPESPSYPADPAAYLLGRATLTSGHTYSGSELDGLLGGAVLSPRRGLQIRTTPAPSAPYNAAAPIVVTYVNWADVEVESDFQPTAGGGDLLDNGDEPKQVISIAVPAQASTGGIITVGAQARAGRGSDLFIATGFDDVLFAREGGKSWQPRKLNVDTLDDFGRLVKRLIYKGVAWTFAVREDRALDQSVHATPHEHIAIDFTTGEPPLLVGSANLPDAG